MALSSLFLNRSGKAGCVSCRKTHSVGDLESCAACDRLVCKTCATYRRQGNPYGYVCKTCYRKLQLILPCRQSDTIVKVPMGNPRFYLVVHSKYTLCIACGSDTYKKNWGCVQCGFVGD